MSGESYTKGFFAQIRAGSVRSAEEIVPLILGLVPARSVVDVAAATGLGWRFSGRMAFSTSWASTATMWTAILYKYRENGFRRRTSPSLWNSGARLIWQSRWK